jgi:protein CpxP
MKKQSLLRLAAVGALAGGMAFAAPPVTTPQTATPPAKTAVNSWRARRQQMRRKFEQKLNLTDAQKTQSKAIFQQARASSKPIFEQLKQNRQALNAAVKSDNTAQIQQLTATQGKLRGELLNIHADARAQFYNLLTPAQKTQLDQMQQARHARMAQRFARHNG